MFKPRPGLRVAHAICTAVSLRALPFSLADESSTNVNYISTRGRAPNLGFEDVLLAGLARDGGLYLPDKWPQLSRETIASFAGRPFAEVAVEVILPFTGGSLTRLQLSAMADAAYASFGHPATTPLVQIDPQTFVLELFHGPTLAFKDVAMQLLARLMDHVLAKRGQTRDHRRRHLGRYGRRGDRSVPVIGTGRCRDPVSGRPRLGRAAAHDDDADGDRTCTRSRSKGTFDDCQALVKAMFNDHAFRDRVSLSGVNSINWARIVAQVTYYFVAAAALGAPHRKVAFSVPTGNFGDIFAGYVARRMGLPIELLVIGSNQNDILPRTLETGVYEMRGVMATSSPSMDIQISSNFERYLFEASGRDADLVARQMQMLAQGRTF